MAYARGRDARTTLQKPTSPYMRYNWDVGLELSLMMLDTYSHTGNETFARETILPVAASVVPFYDQHSDILTPREID